MSEYRSTTRYTPVTITAENRVELGIDPITPDGFVVVSDPNQMIVAILPPEDFAAQFEPS